MFKLFAFRTLRLAGLRSTTCATLTEGTCGSSATTAATGTRTSATKATCTRSAWGSGTCAGTCATETWTGAATETWTGATWATGTSWAWATRTTRSATWTAWSATGARSTRTAHALVRRERVVARASHRAWDTHALACCERIVARAWNAGGRRSWSVCLRCFWSRSFGSRNFLNLWCRRLGCRWRLWSCLRCFNLWLSVWERVAELLSYRRRDCG